MAKKTKTKSGWFSKFSGEFFMIFGSAILGALIGNGLKDTPQLLIWVFFVISFILIIYGYFRKELK